MDQEVLDNLKSRLQKVERQNCQLRRMGIGVVVLVGGFLVMGAGSSDELDVRVLRVHDASGMTRITLDAARYNELGRIGGQITFSHGQADLLVLSESSIVQEGRFSHFNKFDASFGIMVHDSESLFKDKRAVLGTDNLAFYDANGNLSAIVPSGGSVGRPSSPVAPAAPAPAPPQAPPNSCSCPKVICGSGINADEAHDCSITCPNGKARCTCGHCNGSQVGTFNICVCAD